MDSLKTIQKTFRIFLRLTHAAKNTLHCWHGTERSGCIMLDDFLLRRSCF